MAPWDISFDRGGDSVGGRGWKAEMEERKGGEDRTEVPTEGGETRRGANRGTNKEIKEEDGNKKEGDCGGKDDGDTKEGTTINTKETYKGEGKGNEEIEEP